MKGSLNFFKERNRLVIVDVSCGVADVIWNRVSDFFGHELEVTPRKTVNTVIVFSFGKHCCKIKILNNVLYYRRKGYGRRVIHVKR